MLPSVSCGNMATEHEIQMNVVSSGTLKETQITILDDCESGAHVWAECVVVWFPGLPGRTHYSGGTLGIFVYECCYWFSFLFIIAFTCWASFCHLFPLLCWWLDVGLGLWIEGILLLCVVFPLVHHTISMYCLCVIGYNYIPEKRKFSGIFMFSSATQPRRHRPPPPRHNFVVSAITFEGFKLRSSNLTHALFIQISRTSSITDIVVQSKMAAGGHFVKKKSCVSIWNGKNCKSKVIFGHSKWPPAAILSKI